MNNDDNALKSQVEIEKFLEANGITKDDIFLTFNAIVDVSTVYSSKKISNQKMPVRILFDNNNGARLCLEGKLEHKYYPLDFLAKFQQFKFVGKSLEITGTHPSNDIGNYTIVIAIC